MNKWGSVINLYMFLDQWWKPYIIPKFSCYIAFLPLLPDLQITNHNKTRVPDHPSKQDEIPLHLNHKIHLSMIKGLWNRTKDISRHFSFYNTWADSGATNSLCSSSDARYFVITLQMEVIRAAKYESSLVLLTPRRRLWQWLGD